MAIRRSFFVLALILITTAALGSEYGPRTFTRGTGAPAIVRETFTRRVITGDYRLEIANRGVSSAEIWLNGDRIAAPSDFSRNAASIRKHAVLREGDNELAVQLAGAPGGSIAITISAVAGPNGATLSAASGATFTIPPGALTGETSIDLADVTSADLANDGVTMPDGYSFHGAVSLDLGGAELASEGELAIPAGATTPPDRLIIARALDLGDATRFALADTASFEDGKITTASRPYTGVRTGGTYIAMQMPADIAILGVDVHAPDGSAVRDAFVGGMVETFGAAASVLDTLLASQSSFLGLTDATGFAALPVLAANSATYVIASARGTSAVSPLVGSAFVATGGGIGYPPSLADRISIFVGEHLAPDAPDEPPSPCPCPNLDAMPAQIPLGTHVFEPGHAMQLNIFCGSDDVTQSTSLTLQTLIDFFVAGADAHWTLYRSLNTSVATADSSGYVRAVGVGQTFIDVYVVRVTIGAQGGYPFPQVCFSTTTVPVRVDVRFSFCASRSLLQSAQYPNGRVTYFVASLFQRTAPPARTELYLYEQPDWNRGYTDALWVYSVTFSPPGGRDPGCPGPPYLCFANTIWPWYVYPSMSGTFVWRDGASYGFTVPTCFASDCGITRTGISGEGCAQW